MSRPDYARQAIKRIEEYPPGAVFGMSDFADIVDPKTLHMIFARMCSSGIIQKVMRGFYMKPKYSTLLNEYISPRITDIADAIARSYGWNIVPSGITALNMLGLSTQVPAHYEYISDGPYKKYSIDDIDITFKHTNKNTELTKVSYKTAVLIQALKAMGRDNISELDIRRMADLYSDVDKRIIKEEAQRCTSWVYEIIKIICEDRCDDKDC